MRRADLVITELAPQDRADLGIPAGEPGLDEIRVGLVHVAITPFGLDGPGAVRGEESVITDWAAGGLAYSTRRAVPDEDDTGYVPVVAPGRQPEMLAGLAAVIGGLAGLRLARARAKAVLVDVSRQEVQAALLHSLFPTFVSNTVVAGDPTHRISFGMLVHASDGPVYFRPLELHQWRALVEWMGSPDWAVVLTEGLPASIPSFEAFGQLMAPWVAGFTRRDLLVEGQRRRVPVAVPSDLDELFESEQLAVRRAFRALDALGSSARAPALPLFEPEQWPPTRQAQWAEVEAAWGDPTPVPPTALDRIRVSGVPATEGADGLAGDVAAPLDGIRVLDLGRSWSAPFAAMVLADLGADVIKVESTTRVDVLRYSSAFVDGVRDLERSGYNLACNRGKRSVTLDLKHPAGRELLLRLVDVSDALLENFSVDVMHRLGLGPDVLLERNPGLVMVSLSGYGATGPDRSFLSYGDHLLHASGFTSLTGAPDDPYTKLSTFYGDPVGGLYGALGVLAGIAEREHGRTGRWLDLSQLEGLISMLPREVIATSLGDPPQRRIDKSDRHCPHGFYRCVGDDTWVAIAVADDRAWARLRAELVGSGIDVPPLEDFAARKGAEVAVDAALDAYAGIRSPWEVADACRRAGVAAQPVLSTARLLWDDHLAARGFFAWVHRPVTGPGPLPGPIFRMGASGSKVRGYAPLLGEHRRAVMAGLLGLDDDELTRLERDGVFE
jgi:crotonobetainyl-CoA:carnitine CoA-transferase CaiB-like acyl-CoA transferase